jgi:hypothetical protein
MANQARSRERFTRLRLLPPPPMRLTVAVGLHTALGFAAGVLVGTWLAVPAALLALSMVGLAYLNFRGWWDLP